MSEEEPTDSQQRRHEGRNGSKFYLFDEPNGPGKELKVYVPKQNKVLEMVEQTLQPSVDSRTAVAAMNDSTGSGGTGGQACFRASEKVMRKEMWEYQGTHQFGTHYPQVVFTANERHRSVEAWARRKKLGIGKPRRSGTMRTAGRQWSPGRQESRTVGEVRRRSSGQAVAEGRPAVTVGPAVAGGRSTAVAERAKRRSSGGMTHGIRRSGAAVKVGSSTAVAQHRLAATVGPPTSGGAGGWTRSGNGLL